MTSTLPRLLTLLGLNTRSTSARRASRRTPLCLLSLLCLSGAGCLPITLSLDPGGRIALARAEGIFLIDAQQGAARAIHACAAGSQGAWAVFDGRGKRLLYCITSGEDRWTLYTIALDPGARPAQLISDNTRLGYARLSPDGAHVSVVTAPTFGKPALSILRASDGKQLGRLSDVSGFHAWMPDSRSLVILVARRHDAATGVYHGQLCRVDLEGKPTPLFAVAAREEFHLDLDPRRGAIALVAVATAEDPQQKLDLGRAPDGGHRSRLFLYAGGKLRRQPDAAAHHPRYAVFDPTGSRLLINSGGEREKLLVLDADTLRVTHTLASDVPVRSESLGENATILPVWMPGGKSVIFWRYLPTMGLHGKSLRTRIVELSSGKEQDLEHRLERAVYQALGR